MTIKEKQFGQYDGGVFKDPNILKTCTEQDLYFNIRSLDEEIYFLAVNEETVDLTNEQYAYEFCVMQTRRFGVELEQPKEGHVKTTASFWKWYLWWDEYFQRTLTLKQWNEYENKRSKGEDVSQYRPKGDWRNT